MGLCCQSRTIGCEDSNIKVSMGTVPQALDVVGVVGLEEEYCASPSGFASIVDVRMPRNVSKCVG